MNTKPSPSERPLASVQEAAREHGLGKTAVYSWIARGDVPAVCYLRLGGRLYIRRRAFAEFVNGQT